MKLKKSNDGVPAVGACDAVHHTSISSLQCPTANRRLTCRQRRGRRRYNFAAAVSDGEPPSHMPSTAGTPSLQFRRCSVRRRIAVSHAVNGGDAVVTVQRRDAVATLRDAGRHIRGRRRDAGRHTLGRRSNENWRALPRPRRPCYPEVLQLVCQQMVNVMAR